MPELGWLFKQKTGKDPRKLTLSEIEKFAITNKAIYKSVSNIVIQRGSPFPIISYDIDKKIEALIKKL